MLKKIATFLLAITAATLQSGCGGGGGQGGPCCSMAIYTELSTGVWPNASVYGSVDPSTIQCTPGQGYCYTSFSGTTNAYGEFVFQTDALPGTWSVGANGDSNCPSGGTATASITNNWSIYIHCGSYAAGTVVATPGSCVVGTCPATITLAVQPPQSLPTTYALSVGAYNDMGNETGSSSPTSVNGVNLVVPTPTATGASALVIVDPTTNQVLGSALFVETPVVASPSYQYSLTTQGDADIYNVYFYDNTPGAIVEYSGTWCGNYTSGAVLGNGSGPVQFSGNWQCTFQGSMYAHASGYSQSATVPINFP